MTPSAPPLLRVQVDRKQFGTQCVLAGVGFTLAAREVVAITGPSGCGKSTLLRIVAGLDTAFDGAVRFAGTPRLAVAFQAPMLLPWRSVRDNLLLAGAAPAAAADLLQRLGLAEAGPVLASRLSLGMARRVALARALAVGPDILLLDEPFASLDRNSVHAARALLRSCLADRPCAVLLVTHDAEDATTLAHRVLHLSAGPGRLVSDAPVGVIPD